MWSWKWNEKALESSSSSRKVFDFPHLKFSNFDRNLMETFQLKNIQLCVFRKKLFPNCPFQLHVNCSSSCSWTSNFVSTHIFKNVKIKNCVFDMVCISGVIYVQTSSCCRKVSYRKWYILYLVQNSKIADLFIFETWFGSHKMLTNGSWVFSVETVQYWSINFKKCLLFNCRRWRK